MVLSVAARKVATQVEIMPAIMAGQIGVLSSWSTLYLVVAMACPRLEGVRRGNL
jgi:hypothetical protein